MAEEQGLTNRILSAAQRLEGGTASSLPYSPPRQTLSDPARPAVQPGKDFQQDMIADVVNDGLFGPTAQANYAMLLDYALRPPGELFDGRTSAATASEVIANRFPGRPEGSLANVGTELAVGLAEPGPGEFRGLLELAAVLPPSVMTALGKASGLVDEAGEAIRMYHGTAQSFDSPRASQAGLYGEGFYFAPSSDIAAVYANQSGEALKRQGLTLPQDPNREVLGESLGQNIRPGVPAGKLFDLRSSEPIAGTERENLLRALENAPRRIQSVLREPLEKGELTPTSLAYLVREVTEYSQDSYTWLQSAGYSGIIAENGSQGLVFRGEDYVSPFDFEGIENTLVRAGEEGRVSSEELNQALQDLSEFLGK